MTVTCYRTTFTFHFLDINVSSLKAFTPTSGSLKLLVTDGFCTWELRMGKEQSTLAKQGYAISKETENYVVATKDDDTFFIKKIPLKQQSRKDVSPLVSEIQTLNQINHPHVVNSKNSFEDDIQNIYYMVMDFCQGGNLASKIKEMPEESPQESEVLSRIVEICIGLKTIHEAALLHKDLTPENIFLTEFGIVCLGGFGNIHENSQNRSTTKPNEAINYLAPEVFTNGAYDAKSDVWSMGCTLFELCTKKPAFSSETTITLMPKIIGGPCPSLPSCFSFELCDLLNDMLQKEPHARPTASEIMTRPIVLRCLSTKCKTTVVELQEKLQKLRSLADDLERVHEGTSIGSLAGGVIGAVGGITSIVGLILSPFTLGASLIVTGVGVGVGTLGGVTAGVSNITNMVNQSTDRKAIRGIIKEFEQKINAVVMWLQEISYSLKTISSQCPQVGDTEISKTFKEKNLTRLGFRAGRGLSGVAELARLARVVNIGKIAAQTSRVVRVAEVATGVFSSLFVAVDIFFIAMDAKEIHNIRKAREMEEGGATSSKLEFEFDDSVSVSDQATPMSSPLIQGFDVPEEDLAQNQSLEKKDEIKSEIMKFVRSIREAADNMQKILDELKNIISSIPPLQEENEMEWQDMELA